MPRRYLMPSIVIVVIVTAAVTAWFMYRPNAARLLAFRTWMNDPASHLDWKLSAGSRCGSAPFLFPTNGFVGFLWGDSFRPGHSHQGLDIFAGTDIGITRVIAAYSGYLTRQPTWKSAVIVRVPSDPLQPDRQIWLYYAHMADPAGNSFISEEFPPGTAEKYVEAGAFLGYQGDYSGDPDNPVGVHLHFSIVEDDGTGEFKNETEIRNTYDPAPYLGLPVNGYENRDRVPICDAAD